MCIYTCRLSIILLLDMGEGLDNYIKSFLVNFYTNIFELGPDLLYINLHTRSIRVIVLYFIFLVREKWQLEKCKHLEKTQY